MVVPFHGHFTGKHGVSLVNIVLHACFTLISRMCFFNLDACVDLRKANVGKPTLYARIREPIPQAVLPQGILKIVSRCF